MVTTTKKKRAKTTRRVATSVAAASVVGLAVTGAAIAAKRTDQPMPKLPAPGATVEVDLVSKGIEMAFVKQKVNTGPLTGKATFEIESNDGDPSSVRTKVTEFFLTSPANQGGVTIAVEPRAKDSARKSILRLDTAGSPKFHHALALELRVSIQYPEVLGLPDEFTGPVTLEVKHPTELSGKFTGFPHDGAKYKLKDPSALAMPGQRDSNVGSIVTFPVKIEAL